MNVSLSPNPANGLLKLNCFRNEICDIEIYSSLGTKVLSFNKMQNTSVVNIEFLATGIYFCKISNQEKQSKVCKIVKE
jgi:hypothetical protein